MKRTLCERLIAHKNTAGCDMQPAVFFICAMLYSPASAFCVYCRLSKEVAIQIPLSLAI